jgi:hypothetical protein|tara:strand:+ start:641 stop:811 length:171 start_codon:yes stop_codon:yes gene_type:complete
MTNEKYKNMAIKGYEMLIYFQERFNMTEKEAIQSMIKHKQNMGFLKKYPNLKKYIN